NTILENRLIKLENTIIQRQNITPSRDDIKPPENKPSLIVVPDKKYIRKLIDNLNDIKGHLGEWEFQQYKKGLETLTDTGDFEDSEEIIFSVHELIKKYIYGSDTKVSLSDWEKLEKYIENAGYKPVPVRAGDNITSYKSYFERPIQAQGGVPDTIKQIQLKPFILTYEDDGETATIKLCGKCTYYR
ncbi:MAG: hypothetical protein K2J39_00780, partial [Ruminococcus sp.]|nr:hypothetical protein [Ruminococcus sp.]